MINLCIKWTPVHVVHSSFLLNKIHILPIEILKITSTTIVVWLELIFNVSLLAFASLILLIVLIYAILCFHWISKLLLGLVIDFIISKYVATILLLNMFVHQVIVVDICFISWNCKFFIAKSLFFWVNIILSMLILPLRKIRTFIVFPNGCITPCNICLIVIFTRIIFKYLTICICIVKSVLSLSLTSFVRTRIDFHH